MEINRQYIGARYVPKFYEGSNGTEWDANHIYEPLTIVTYLNNSYTSKKSVPASIGNPMLNPEYWAATGNYNAQIETYRQEVAELSAEVDVLAPKTNEAYRIAHNSVLANKTVIFVGDSYGESPSVGQDWCTLAKNTVETLGVTAYRCHISGGGFGSPVKFLTALQGIAGTISDHSDVTDIYVMGGVNDVNYTSVVNDGYSAFVSYCSTEYPNAMVHVGVCSLSTTPTSENAIMNTIPKLYRNAVNIYGGKYISKSEFGFHNYSGLGDDGLHPNATGGASIASFLVNYIVNGEVDTNETLAIPTITAESGFTVTASCNEFKDLMCVVLNLTINSVTLAVPSVINNLKVAHIDGGYFRGVLECSATILCNATKNDDSVIWNFPVTVKVSNGDIYLTSANPSDIVKTLVGTSVSITLPINVA